MTKQVEMIEHGKVVGKEGRIYRVEIPFGEKCEKCKLCMAFMKPGTNTIVARSKEKLNIGEEVNIFFNEKKKLGITALIFFLPVVVGVIFAIIFDLIFKKVWAAPAGGGAGLITVLLLLKLFEKKLVSYPEIKRRKQWEI